MSEVHKSGITDDRWTARLHLVAETLAAVERPHPTRQEPSPLADVLRLLDDATAESIWFTIAVLSARLPAPNDVIEARRASQLDGPEQVLVAALRTMTPSSATRAVSVTAGTTIVDLGDLVTSPLGTGIQRVARNVTREWDHDRKFEVVGWSTEMDSMSLVDRATRDRVLLGNAPSEDEAALALPAQVEVVVPWRCTYVLPELAIQPRRCSALQAMATYSANRCGVIGFDCVPLTSSETTAASFPAVFALNLAAVAQFDVVAAISEAAATEYRGWRRMLEGAGLEGPGVVPVDLPGAAPEPTDADLVEARDRLLVADLPMVLCVGSHEPRKNHLAVLHAAEVLWRRGRRFSLTFVGGHSWGDDELMRRLGELQGAGRPVESISRLPDRLLWAAYRLARCTVFPSLNEGFGLPVAESLAAGTPVITSAAGSMLELAAEGGAIVIDPLDDQSLTAALDRLITDDGLRARLHDEATRRVPSGWETYAERLWDTFHAVPMLEPSSAAAPPMDGR
jgi:glycosyltransferase involved in cell wall biosynthesis